MATIKYTNYIRMYLGDSNVVPPPIDPWGPIEPVELISWDAINSIDNLIDVDKLIMGTGSAPITPGSLDAVTAIDPLTDIDTLTS